MRARRRSYLAKYEYIRDTFIEEVEIAFEFEDENERSDCIRLCEEELAKQLKTITGFPFETAIRHMLHS